jgi:hypothetical protein
MRRHDDPERPQPAAPGFLLLFLLATMAVVGAVVALGLTDSDWFLVAAVALLLVALAFLLGRLRHALGEGEPPSFRDDSRPPLRDGR